MIISRTPLRISFVGGGSDISSFYNYKMGAVISTAINKYIYIAVNNQFDGRIIVNYSKTEIVKEIESIENNLVREGLKKTRVKGGIHITSISDIPGEGTGMGSSSAYIVGLLNALYAYQGKHVTAETLAKQACEIEISILKKPIGKQDQYITGYGGFNYIQFNTNGSVFVDPIICLSETKQKLEKRLLLFYTGITRSADPILAKQGNSMKRSKTKRDIMDKMVLLTKQLRKDLNNNDLSTFGKILHENWLYKKQMSDGITTNKIDYWYEKARAVGAQGGKLLGAGGGGFLLLYATEKDHAKIKAALADIKNVPFNFEQQGSKIIFLDN
jgi:D-glycero-alpha-D-manno-heptose-7-phosphate kinase